jgi:hypothetical protein
MELFCFVVLTKLKVNVIIKLYRQNDIVGGSMDKIRLYHGSESIISKPIKALGKITNDYGQGFYCTEDVEMAKEWACKNNKDGFVNEYELDIKNLKILNLFDEQYNVLHWISLLLNNRIFNIQEEIAVVAKEYLLKNYLVDTSQYDIIIGYRADDSYFSYAHSFISNSLSIRQLEKAMKLGKLGSQVVLVSEKAFNSIKFVRYQKVNKNVYYENYVGRDLKARYDYKEEVKLNKLVLDDMYIVDIIRKEKDNK